MRLILVFLICTAALAVVPEDAIYESWVHYVTDFKNNAYIIDDTTEAQYYTTAYHPNFLALDAFDTDKKGATYELGWTWYSDLSSTDFKTQYLLPQVPTAYPVARGLDVQNLPDVKTWYDAVQPAVQQDPTTGQSWAYAAVAAVEAFYNKKIADPAQHIQLSVQQLINCATTAKTPNDGLQWIKTNGIDLKADYVAGCAPETANYKIPEIRLVKQDFLQVKAALQFSPVTVCFDLTNFQQYTGGPINQDCDEKKVNYCGLLYGYENDEWIIKTSLGTKWGVEGEVRIKHDAQCGVKDFAAFPMEVNEDIQALKDDFEAYKVKFGKTYTPEEEPTRFGIYAYSKLDNSELHYFGETPFTDLSPAEFAAKYLITDFTLESEENIEVVEEVAAAGDIDWREKGIITDVFNQGNCVSSWAIAAKNALESYFNLQTSKKVALSLQQLIDCSDTLKPLDGCKGGIPGKALDWIKNKGLSWESAYPYTGIAAACQTQNGPLRPNSYAPLVDVNAIAAALAKRPVVVCFDASNLQNYVQDTILQADCVTSVHNYCGLLVGMTAEYWIVQGSLGTQWGIEGYIHIAYGNNCGIGSGAYNII